MNQKIAALFILFALVFAAFMAPVATDAQSPTGVNIVHISPKANGPAGAAINIQGSLYTANGSYQLLVGRTLVASGTAEGYYVDVNFTVPELPSATYPLILRDLKINVNSSTQFTIATGYQISAQPTLVQEGGSVTVNAAVTGGQLGTSYGADISIISPVGFVYSGAITLGAPNVQGTASASVTFPSSSFTDGATDYAGVYRLTFNGSLATNQFNVNILDSTSYHRGQTVTIRATGYQVNQAAIITVSSGSTVIDTKSVSADGNGVISTTWIVSDNAPIGELIIKISTSEGTPKSPADQETLTVSGYTVNVKLTNLSGKDVPDLSVKATDSTTQISTTVTANSTGVATFKLEKGAYDLTAYLDDVIVGSANITVTEDATFTLRCQLTDLKVSVKTADGVTMPFVDLYIDYQYQSGSISRSGNVSGQTDPSGSYTLTSMVAGATYNIDASIYDHVFNTQNNTVTSLSNQATTDVVIICPSKNVTFSITGFDTHVIPNARIELVELNNGLFFSGSTDNSGTAQVPVTFGMYRVRIYKDNSLLSQENLQVFEDTQKQIRCTLYGIQLQVAVVDFFGSPIANAKVTLNGPSRASASTQANGVATFNNIVGGDIQIIAQAQGTSDASQAINLNINEPVTVQIKIAKYISVGGMLMQASTLITFIVIFVISLMFVGVEVYRRRKVSAEMLS